MEQPVTEKSNILSQSIDIASSKEIISILYACDQEIFNGWDGGKGVNNETVVEKMHKVANKISQTIENPKGAVVISGCGTSGRIAFLTARTFNKYLKMKGKNPCFHYIIAGSDRALFTSIELAEDDPFIGAKTLKEVTEDKTEVVYIGVTCGFSAPFVAGQLDFCLSHTSKFTPVLMGFNYPHQARNIQIEKWYKTFLTVVKELEKAEKLDEAFILNPIVGPEPITGSSRMKSGTTTRILLEILSITAIHQFPKSSIPTCISMYESVCGSVYKHTESLAGLMQLAGDSLTAKGHVYYLGHSGLGLMAMIDASECPPTYGASFLDIRGFVTGGFLHLNNNDGDLSHLGWQYKISIQDFESDVIPTLTSQDFVVLLGEEVLKEISPSVFDAPCKKAYVSFYWEELPPAELKNVDLNLMVNISVPELESMVLAPARDVSKQVLEEVACKWVVNSLSTGAHILKGKVCQNMMIDVKVSNNKLFHRAVGIVQKYSHLTTEESQQCLLKSIYGTDCLTDDHTSASVVSHIGAAANKDLIVPVAILVASLHCTVEGAKDLIKKQPIIRKLLLVEG
ncbi:glucokinase regulatory protein-like isoform X3 [Physella acuta]|nr:glucokinase regulatory protein-like isoform X3 [Physella acuta]XP_059173572.1 glucokinase regulatory protein-like isoform X3 [Physella acuta]XP_059173573.1 glucokinase regulatory protein-like isoform X3 [Physella acuta]XP_059173574.1 glucokinase regulatory protein-like isoform X3 [Physella acuta]XP_059173575.1 glucokinase regulatory protein-like isoform X3 [Physella acuta]XP_059173576.1 glucokinase regulatory protein-like isoform X3 [Physella acuta]